MGTSGTLYAANTTEEKSRPNEMTIFFTADQHFGHANILKYEADYRKDHAGVTFRTVRHMDDAIVANWNATVGMDDTIYALGDFSYKIASIAEYLPRLNGRIILIVGNHDPFFELCKTGREAEARKLAINAGFADMYMQHVIEIEGIGVVKLSHFPYAPPQTRGRTAPTICGTPAGTHCRGTFTAWAYPLPVDDSQLSQTTTHA
jgi:calcineurin-like phosphoesterase family protein